MILKTGNFSLEEISGCLLFSYLLKWGPPWGVTIKRCLICFWKSKAGGCTISFDNCFHDQSVFRLHSVSACLVPSYAGCLLLCSCALLWILALDLLALLLLVQLRRLGWWLSLLPRHCWLVVVLLPTRTPRAFSTELLPSLTCCKEPFLIKCRNVHTDLYIKLLQI